MKNTKKIIIKMFYGLFGGGLIILGMVNLIIVISVMKTLTLEDISAQDLFIKFLFFLKLFFYNYLIIVGIVVYREIKWASKGVMPLPFVFMLIDYLSRTERTVVSYILWLLFLFVVIIFCVWVENSGKVLNSVNSGDTVHNSRRPQP